MSNKKIRLSELGKINPIGAMDHRRLLNGNGTLAFFDNLPRKQRRRLAMEGKQLAQEYRRVMSQLFQSGAKFPTDRILREMAFEYNNRYASSGIYTQPLSFNYFEPFLHLKLIKQVAPYVETEKEFNHLFYIEDYFDYLTSGDSDGFDVSSLLTLPQDQIFHFSTNGSINDTAFLNGEGREFLISGFSIIRRAKSLHWYLIGGEALDEDEWKIRCSSQQEVNLKEISPLKQKFLSEIVAKNDFKLGEPKPLEGTSTHIRTIITGEFDIVEKKHISRCYLAEYQNSFDIVCDDPEIFSDFRDFETKNKAMSNMIERFNRSAVLWSLAEGLFQLPMYFNTRLALSKDVTDKSRQRLPKKKGGLGLSTDYVVIPAIETNSVAPNLTITRVNLPQYEIETEGHWRRLNDGEYGIDRHGNRVLGKTWISESSKWKHVDATTSTIFLKDTLGSAKVKIEQYLEASARIAEEARSKKAETHSDAGELYVMRCAAMKEQIFKVGFTDGDSSERAIQLSSATGVPLAFLVIKKWRHAQARKLETEAHMMLAPYRLNDSREFFLASYDAIEKIIEFVITRTNT
ncbi:GIY-YIG nuclease family protein [Undibacterium sp. Tian12W]|uniref:GIY-YIG nuclease family protein n=1 Tax=Undibacterium sp. Tian12W TaxID=3413054 RepID=UPI003BF3505D